MKLKVRSTSQYGEGIIEVSEWGNDSCVGEGAGAGLVAKILVNLKLQQQDSKGCLSLPYQI